MFAPMERSNMGCESSRGVNNDIYAPIRSARGVHHAPGQAHGAGFHERDLDAAQHGAGLKLQRSGTGGNAGPRE